MRSNQEKKLRFRRLRNRVWNLEFKIWIKNIVWRATLNIKKLFLQREIFLFSLSLPKHFWRKVLVIFLVCAWIFSGWPPVWQNPPFPPEIKKTKAAIIAQYTGGLLVYADGTAGTPKYKTFDNTTGFGSEQSATSVGAAAIEWIRVAASPTKDQWIIATRDSGDVIKAQVCTGVDGGVSCGAATQITATAGAHGLRNFDVAYEQLTGDALLVYGDSTIDMLRKIEWTGGSWQGDAQITTTRTGGTVEWVELTSRKASDQIGIAYSDNADNVSAYRWSGTAVGDEATAAITLVAVAADVRKFDVSFEHNSGDMFVGALYTTGGAIAYGALSGTTWTITTGTTPDFATVFLDLPEQAYSSPGDDDLAVSTHGNLTASNTTEGYGWDDAITDGTAGDDPAQVFSATTNMWQLSAVSYFNATYYGVAVFSGATTADDIDWWTMSSATAITDQLVNTRTRGASRFIDLFDYPSADKVLLLTADANSDLWADTWDGATPSATVWADLVGATPLEDSLASATTDVVDFAFRLSPITTLATGTNPGDSEIAPGGSITSVNGFTLTTSTGTDAITAIVVNLSTNSGVGTLTITDGADTVLGSIGGGIGTGIVTGSNSISITSTNATTGGTAFKVKVTPLSHANMPAPAGGSYAITGVVTDWTGTNTKAGQATDTSSTVTIDNASPNGANPTGGSAGDAKVNLNWTTSNSGDFSRSVVLRWTSSSVGSEKPAEGTDYTIAQDIDTAAVACVRTTDGASTAVSDAVDGSGGGGGCRTTALTNGLQYSYKIFQKDSNGNYDAGVVFTNSPFTPAAVGTLTVDIVDAGGIPVGSPTMAMGGVTFSFPYQTATGVFGVTDQKIKVNNTTANPQWTLSIAASSGPDALWSNVGETKKYDFNDLTANAEDGSDSPDTVGGQMTINASGATLGGTCSATDITKGSSSSFSEDVTDSIPLLTAGAGADTGCYWYLTSVSVSQTIPAAQAIDSYTLNLVLTVTPGP